MLKTYQFKTHCKGGSHSSKNCKYHFARTRDKIKVKTSLRLQTKYSRLFNLGEMSCFNQHNAVQ